VAVFAAWRQLTRDNRRHDACPVYLRRRRCNTGTLVVRGTGRDPSGYAGVAWCFGKHDRPWKEREIFGMVRYMNAAGLERTFAMDRYLA